MSPLVAYWLGVASCGTLFGLLELRVWLRARRDAPYGRVQGRMARRRG